MKDYFIKMITHPAVHYNLITIGVLITIGMLHNHAHFSMTKDADAYGEVSFVGSGDADIDRGYGAKVGLKYSF
jgi:hypothetical protein